MAYYKSRIRRILEGNFLTVLKIPYQSLTSDKRANITDIIYSPAMCLIKLVILFQLGSIFASSRIDMYWIIYALFVLTIMFYIACIIQRILQCISRKKIWNLSISSRCINSSAGILFLVAINIVSDFVLLVISLSEVWRLQMPQRRKWQVSAVFVIELL